MASEIRSWYSLDNENGRKLWKMGGLRKLGIAINLLETLDLASFQAIHLTVLHIFLEFEFDGNVDRIEGVVKGLPNHQEIRKFWLSSLEPTCRATNA